MNKRAEAPLGEDFHQKWRSAFEHFAELHDDDAGIAGWTASGLQARLGAFRRLWRGASPGALWLDIGCGAGTYTRLLHDHGLQALGIDYSVRSLEKAKARSAAGIRWLAADIASLPLRPATCNGALCFGVLQAIPDSCVALEAIATVIEPGGTLWVDALNARCLPNRITTYRRRRAGKPAHLRYETDEILVRALEQCGFETIQVHWAPIMPPSLQRLQPVIESRAVRWALRRCRPLARWISHSILIEARRAATGR